MKDRRLLEVAGILNESGGDINDILKAQRLLDVGYEELNTIFNNAAFKVRNEKLINDANKILTALDQIIWGDLRQLMKKLD